MPGPAEASSSEHKPPIFAEDIPCPQCGYNLRGLVEPICPECGFVFDPKQVRQDHIGARRSMPVTWVLRHVLPHPVRFWTLPLARAAQTPRVGQLIAMASTGAAMGPAGILLTLIALGGSSDGVSVALFMLWAGSLAAALVGAGLHELLCRLALSAAGRRQSSLEVARFTRHGAAWLVVLLPSCVACLLMAVIFGAEKGTGGPPPSLSRYLSGVSIVGLLGCFVSTACWGISVYTGARAVSQVNRGVAAWCVLCNPFLYVSGASAAGLLIVLAS